MQSVIKKELMCSICQLRIGRENIDKYTNCFSHKRICDDPLKSS